jgi:hypothetical protein
MDKRIIIIAILTVTAIILTIVRESGDPGASTFSLIPSTKQQISGDRVYSMADTTLRALGIKKGNIRPIKNRNDVRVLMPQSFDPLLFVKAMKDSLEEFEADIVSMENIKEKSSTVQVKSSNGILKSFLFSKEPVTITKKGVTPLVKKAVK